MAQMFREGRREFFQLVDILRLTLQRERQFARLLEIAIVNFQSLDRFKFPGQHVEHIAVEIDPSNEDRDGRHHKSCYRAPHQGAPFRDKACNDFARSHRQRR